MLLVASHVAAGAFVCLPWKCACCFPPALCEQSLGCGSMPSAHPVSEANALWSSLSHIQVVWEQK